MSFIFPELHAYHCDGRAALYSRQSGANATLFDGTSCWCHSARSVSSLDRRLTLFLIFSTFILLVLAGRVVDSKSGRFSVRAHRTARTSGPNWSCLVLAEAKTIVCAPSPVQNPTLCMVKKEVFRVLFLVAFPDPGFKVSPGSLVNSEWNGVLIIKF